MAQSGLTDRATSALKKVTEKALTIETSGPYEGVWNLDMSGGRFFRERRLPGGFLRSDIVISETFQLTDITSVEVISTKKNMAGIAKATIGGALVGGVIGAAALGTLAATSNTLFVEVVLQNGIKLYGDARQDAFQHMAVAARTSGHPICLGIKSQQHGGEPNFIVIGIALLIAIVVIGNVL